MLNLLSVNKYSHHLKSGEIITYLPIPEKSYDVLKTDYSKAPHFSLIDEIELKGSKGVYIKSNSINEGYIAAIYLYKKFLATKKSEVGMAEDFEYGDDYNESDEVEDFLFPEGELDVLPIVTSEEFAIVYTNSKKQRLFGMGNFDMQMEQNSSNRDPYWNQGNYPVVIQESPFRYDISEPMRQFDRFILYISVKGEETDLFFQNDSIDNYEKKVIFECDFEFCDISQPTEQYYEIVLENIAERKGFKLSKSLKKTKLIDELKEYRGRQFAGNQDIELMVNRAIRKKNDHGKTLTKADFSKAFIITDSLSNVTKDKAESVSIELDQLIGLEDVKQQLTRIVNKMKFNKERRLKGLKTEPIYCSAVFMGNPGTAKTTVARMFGKMLCKSGILDNEKFIEVSRKDLVGKFVGHTAPLVSELFSNYSGGTIFIDEAYSLMNEGLHNDGYSAESMSELIRQMENNPQTLVILAGYTDKMREMIQYANPGLRSRLTNIIEFKDYRDDEMLDIFLHFLRMEDYRLEDIENSKKIIRNFIDEIRGLEYENIGNGRLMRKLFQTAVGFMSERIDQDMETLYLSDIKQAIKEIINTERIVSGENKRVVVGFYNN